MKKLKKIQSEISKGLAEFVENSASKDAPYVTSSISVGVLLSPQDGIAFRTLIDNAKIACRAVKRDGRNGICLCGDKNTERMSDTKLIRNDITEKMDDKCVCEVDYISFYSICRVMMKQLAARNKKKAVRPSQQ